MRKISLLIFYLFICIAVNAQVTLPKIFADHMVLQQKQPVKVWGWASPGEKISVSIQGQKQTTKANANGNWIVNLEPLATGGSNQLIVKGKNAVILNDVVVGEVWLCSGQSNMEWQLSNANNGTSEISQASYPLIRHFKVGNIMKGAPATQIESGEWKVCSPSTAGEFTAVGYFFAKEIHKTLNVPIGIINASFGGTFAEAWMSQQALAALSGYKQVPTLGDDQLENWFKSVESLYTEYDKKLNVKLIEGYKAIDTTWSSTTIDDSKWIPVPFPGNFDLNYLPRFDGTVWFRTTIELSGEEIKNNLTLNLGRVDDIDETFVNGTKIGSTEGSTSERSYKIPSGLLKSGRNTIAIKVTDWWERGGFIDGGDMVFLQGANFKKPLGNEKWRMNFSNIIRIWVRSPNVHPNLLFNGVINPIIPFTIKGALWYQGENNADFAYQYREQLPALIKDWRTRWNQGNFPFYFVQLPNFQKFASNSEHQGSNWADIRESFAKTLSVENTGMAVTIDIGDSTDIHPTNKKDVGLRLSLIALKEAYGKSVIANSPTLKSAQFNKDGAEIEIETYQSSLVVHDRYGYAKGFEIAGDDQIFHYGSARVNDNKIFVSSPYVVKPVAIRYGWSSNPDANLFNKEGLPMAPFRSDNWKLTTEGFLFDCWIGQRYKLKY